MYTQKTIKTQVACTGIGLHSGNPVTMTFHPASVGTGIVFRRIDLPQHPTIKVTAQHIVDVTYATTIGENGVTAQTVEHILSAVYALGVSNLMIDITGSETPIMDGSAACFVNMLLDAGLDTQPAAAKVMRVTKQIEVRRNDSIISVEPYDGLKITYTIDFPNRFIGVQTKTFELRPLAYMDDIAQARTFCIYEEVENLWKKGLSRGGSLDNVLVFAEDHILNDHLRYSDEPVRHKILDLIGDFAFLGHPLFGHIKVYKGGHLLHAKCVNALLNQPDAWTYVSDQDYFEFPSQLDERSRAILPAVNRSRAVSNSLFV